LNGSAAVEVWEQWDGWRTLVDTIAVHLAGAQRFDDWFKKVALPAFVSCVTQLYPPP
jgi:hypothetical protein